MRNFLLMGLLALLAACTPAVPGTAPIASQAALATSQAIATGQLYCRAGGELYQAGVVKVPNATAASVAAVCAGLIVAGRVVGDMTMPGVPAVPGYWQNSLPSAKGAPLVTLAAAPVSVQPGTLVTLATVPAGLAAAVDASKPGAR